MIDPQEVVAALIAWVTSADFLREHWQKQPYVDRSEDAARFTSILSADAIAGFIWAASSSVATRLHVITGGLAVPVPLQNGGPSAKESPLDEADKAYEAGRPLLLTQVHLQSVPIARFCRAFESRLTAAGVLLSRPIGANLYMAPPRSQGLRAHYDDHDAFVIQIDGEKRWRVYEATDVAPIDRDVGSPVASELPPLLLDTTLRAGDILYLPRGFFHEAETRESSAVHLTLAVRPCTWLDLLSRLARRSVRFREALPLGIVDDPAATREELARRVSHVVADGDVGDAARELADGFARSQGRIPEGGFRHGHEAPLALDTIVTRRNGEHVTFEHTETEARLVLSGCGLASSSEMAPAFSFVAERVRFAPKELPDVLADEGKLQLVRELIAAGLLTTTG